MEKENTETIKIELFLKHIAGDDLYGILFFAKKLLLF